MGHHHEGFNWWQIASGIVLIALIINGYIQKYRQNKKEKLTETGGNAMEIKTIKVEGMTCNHCKNNVEMRLKESGLVDEAQVNLAEKSVILKGDHIDVEKVKAVVDQLGYKVL